LEYVVENQINYNLSLINLWPPHESVNVFNDFKKETIEWENSLMSAKEYLVEQSEHGTHAFDNAGIFSTIGTIDEAINIFKRAEVEYKNPHKIEVLLNEQKIANEKECLIIDRFMPENGNCFTAPIGDLVDGYNIDCVVYENDKPLGHHVASHDEIRRYGSGRYSIWPNPPNGYNLYMSTSDNTNPRTNGRYYSLRHHIVSPKDELGRTRMPVLIAADKLDINKTYGYLLLSIPGNYKFDIPENIDPSQLQYYTLHDVLDTREPRIIDTRFKNNESYLINLTKVVE